MRQTIILTIDNDMIVEFKHRINGLELEAPRNSLLPIQFPTNNIVVHLAGGKLLFSSIVPELWKNESTSNAYVNNDGNVIKE